jgi:hypothetical protein
VQTVYPVEELLFQWLLLPLFADLGLVVFILRSARGRVAVALSCLLLVFAAGTIAVIVAGGPGASGVEFVTSMLVPPLLAVFALCYSGGRQVAGSNIYRVAYILLPSLVFLILAWNLGWSQSSTASVAFSIVYYVIVIAFLLRAFTDQMLSGSEPILFGVSVTVLFISGPIYNITNAAMGIHLAVFPYAYAMAGALLSWGVARYKKFSVAPSAEDFLRDRDAENVMAGIFISRDARPSAARAFFTRTVKHGLPGLFIGRTPPQAFMRATGIHRVPAIWLAQSRYERCLAPAETEVLLHIMRDYAGQAGRSVVLMEDFDYIVSNAGLFQALDFISELVSVAERSGLTVIVHSGLLTAEERAELAELGVRPMRV